MKLFTLPTLSSQSPTPNTDGQLSTTNIQVPTFADKQGYRDWCVDDKTNYLFYSATEGLTPGVRVGSSNPAYKLHGLIADYDGYSVTKPQSADLKKLAGEVLAKLPGGCSPTWLTRTYSGGIRAIWAFTNPVLVDNPDLSKAFVKLLFSELKAVKLTAGFDPCSYDLTQYYALGDTWTPCGAPLADGLVVGKLIEAMSKTSTPKGIVDIPMLDIGDRVEALFPGRWKGDFKEGARGPLFWIPDGVDRIGAIVQSHGMWSFSSRAPKSFVSWAEILGDDWVKQYRVKKVEEATDDVYHDGKRFWRKGVIDTWDDLSREDFTQDLRLSGFSPKPRKKGDPATEIDEVMGYVRKYKRISGVAPFPFDFDEVVRLDGRSYLNESHSLRVMEPASGPDAGCYVKKWPTLWKWWNEWLQRPDSVHFFLTWMKRFYEGALQGNLSPGHTLILAGETDQGKSLFATHITRKIFGAASDAGNYLMGAEQFNSNLCGSGVWYIDDNTGAKRAGDHKYFSEMIKKVTATAKITYREMYRAPVNMPRRGRVILTTNTDADSLSILPSLDGNILDKLIILKMKENYTPWFRQCATYADIDKVLDDELPHFLHWLVNAYTPPPRVVQGASPRFGLNSYIDPDIAGMAKDLSSDMRDYELIEVWWRLRGDKEPWEGSATELMGEIGMFEELKAPANKLNVYSLGRTLSRLASKEDNIEKRVGHEKRVTYEIAM